MNIFDAIYLNSNDPFEHSFITTEATLDIAVERANKEYMYESGLIELSDNKLFIEATESAGANSETNVKKENAFVKTVKAICEAIGNFIGDIISFIVNLFDGRDHLDTEAYLKSTTGQVRLQKDVKELEAIVDDEIRKGNKLLQKISKMTGVDDEVIDNYIRDGAEKVRKLAPVVIPAALGFGFKAIFTHKFKEKKNEIKKAEKAATEGNKSDSKKNGQKLKVLNHMEWLVKQVGSAAKDWGSSMSKAMKKNK